MLAESFKTETHKTLLSKILRNTNFKAQTPLSPDAILSTEQEEEHKIAKFSLNTPFGC